LLNATFPPFVVLPLLYSQQNWRRAWPVPGATISDKWLTQATSL